MLDNRLAENVERILLYFDLFDFPVHESELSAFLGEKNTKIAGVHDISGKLGFHISKDGYIVRDSKPWSLFSRKRANLRFRNTLPVIKKTVKYLSFLPFIRGVALTGSLSKKVAYGGEDFDFLLLVKKKRLWCVINIIQSLREHILARILPQWYKHTCCNVFLSVNQLGLPVRDHFTAVELATMKPLTAPKRFRELFSKNPWMRSRISALQCRWDFHMALPWWIKLIQRVGEVIFQFFFIGGNSRVLEHFLRRRNLLWNLPSLQDLGISIQYFENINRVFLRDANHIKLGDLMNDLFLNPRKIRYRGEIKTKFLRKKRTLSVNRSRNCHILLTHAYFLNLTHSEKKIMKPYVPLGPLSVCAYLREQGYTPEFYDTTFKTDWNAFEREISRYNTPVIGIYALEMTRKFAREMIRVCQRNHYIVVVGGPDPSNDPEYYLALGVDLVVQGEGEETVLEILKALYEDDRPVREIPGVITCETRGPKRAPFPDIDALPFPARDMVDFQQYFRTWKKHHGMTSLHLTTSRGCPYSCAWCSKPVFGNSFRHSLWEFVEHERMGFRCRNDADWIARLRYLLDHPRERARMGSRAREAAKRFSWEKILPQYRRMFDGL